MGEAARMDAAVAAEEAAPADELDSKTPGLANLKDFRVGLVGSLERARANRSLRPFVTSGFVPDLGASVAETAPAWLPEVGTNPPCKIEVHAGKRPDGTRDFRYELTVLYEGKLFRINDQSGFDRSIIERVNIPVAR